MNDAFVFIPLLLQGVFVGVAHIYLRRVRLNALDRRDGYVKLMRRTVAGLNFFGGCAFAAWLGVVESYRLMFAVIGLLTIPALGVLNPRFARCNLAKRDSNAKRM